jgi:hypothetical protein
MENFTLTKFLQKWKDDGKSFEELLVEFEKTDESGKSLYNIKHKTDAKLAILYSGNEDWLSEEASEETLSIISEAKSYVVDVTSLKLMAYHINIPLQDEECDKFLETNDFDDVVWSRNHEGTTIVTFYAHDSWYITTKRCLDAYTSFWNQSISFGNMFDEVRTFSMDDLDKSYIYYFILSHPDNTNIVSPDKLKACTYHVLTLDAEFKPVTITIDDKTPIPTKMEFGSIDDVKQKVKEYDAHDRKKHKVSTVGMVGMHITKDFKVTLLTYPTSLYSYLMTIKPNKGNQYQGYLELYQRNQLKDFLKYSSGSYMSITRFLSTLFRILSYEINDIYHMTRQRANPEIYALLPKIYRHVLYLTHMDYKKCHGRGPMVPHYVFALLKNAETSIVLTLIQERYNMSYDPVLCNFLTRELPHETYLLMGPPPRT